MNSLSFNSYVLPFFGAALLSAGFCLNAGADDAHYTAVKSQAEAAYDMEKTHCDTLSGNDKDVCVKEAKAKRTISESDAKAQHKSMEAHNDATKDKQKAEYEAAKERCDNFKGSEQDACVDTAKEKYHQ